MHSLTLQHVSNTVYRPDIDGLRAVAIMAVVIFHLFPTSLRAGYIGVDIFFVISGFVITTQLLQDFGNNRFSFKTFYTRRIKRLFPALILVLTAALIFGWFVLLAEEYKQLSRQIIANTLFVSNFISLNDVGYFNAAAYDKPFLHLWSLSIEWQYYLIWPVLLYGILKAEKKPLLPTLLFFLISFAICVVWVRKNPTAAFYLPQARIWELLSGSACAMIMPHASFLHSHNKYLSNLLAATGIALVLCGYVAISHQALFPGEWTFAVVLGTAFIISAGPRAWFNRVILSAWPAVWLGLISYSLYLWHWPILSFARIIGGGNLDISTSIACLMLAVILACITYWYIESPARVSKQRFYRPYALLLMMSLLSLVSVIVYYSGGVHSRAVVINNQAIRFFKNDAGWSMVVPGCGKKLDVLKDFSVCSHDKRGNVKYAVIGDSKAAVLFPGLVRTSSDSGRWLVISGYGYNSSLPVLSDAEIYKKYQHYTSVAVNEVAKNKAVKAVVLVASTRLLFNLENDFSIDDLPFSPNADLAIEGLSAVVARLVAAGKKVVLLVDNPTLPYLQYCIRRRTEIPLINNMLVGENPKCILSLKEYQRLTSSYRDVLNKVQLKYPDNVMIYDATKHLCDNQAGICTHIKNGNILYSVTDHISDYAADLLGKDLNWLLEDN